MTYAETGEFDPDEEPVAYALVLIAKAIDRLGNGDAATPMGGLEALGKSLSASLDGIAQEIYTHGGR